MLYEVHEQYVSGDAKGKVQTGYYSENNDVSEYIMAKRKTNATYILMPKMPCPLATFETPAAVMFISLV